MTVTDEVKNSKKAAGCGGAAFIWAKNFYLWKVTAYQLWERYRADVGSSSCGSWAGYLLPLQPYGLSLNLTAGRSQCQNSQGGTQGVGDVESSYDRGMIRGKDEDSYAINSWPEKCFSDCLRQQRRHWRNLAFKLRFKGRNQNTLWWVGIFTIPNGPGLCPSNYYCVSLLDTTRSLFQLRLSNIIEAGTLCTWHHQQQAGLDIWFWEAISVSDVGVEQHSCDSTFGVCCSSALKHHLRETSAIHFDPANVGPQKKMVPGRRSFPFGDCIFGKGYDHVSTFIQLPNHGPIPTWYT